MTTDTDRTETEREDIAFCRANCPQRSRGQHSYDCAERSGLADADYAVRSAGSES